jgi:hypothetical protein
MDAGVWQTALRRLVESESSTTRRPKHIRIPSVLSFFESPWGS